MRLIDADALNEKLCETTIFIKGGEIFQRMINDAPTIEPDGDTISRQDALAEFRDGRDVYDIMESIEALPSAPDSRQRGEWQKEIKGNGWNEWAVLTCDQCEAVIENPTFETNFCPNCGARMKGGAE